MKTIRFFSMVALVGAAALIAASCAGGHTRQTLTVASPDGKNTITIAFAAAGPSPTTPTAPGASAAAASASAITTISTAPTFAVACVGRPIIEPSAFKITLAGAGDVAAGATLLSFTEDSVDLTFEMPWGKSSTIRDHFSRLRLRFKSPAGILWDLEIRAYDDGVAFRYAFPEQPNLSDFILQAESTEMRLSGSPTLLLTTTDTFAWSHERLYTRSPLALVPAGSFIELPVLVEWPAGMSAAVSEAALRDFGGLYLQRDPRSDEPLLRTVLSPRLDHPDAAVIGHTPHQSPWRVIQLADQAGRLVESNLLVCLNDPPPPDADFSWLRLGKTTWHWWNGTAEEALLGKKKTPFTSFEYHRGYIDFCASHGIAYHAVVSDDRPWHKQTRVGFAPGPDTDIAQPRPGLDLARIIAYGRGKGVGVRLWVHWRALVPCLEEAFARYEAWGIQGLMVDFLDRDDQEMVNLNWRILEAAARHHLHIQFHGSYHPSGEQRTFPNLFNREGALNLEYLKWGMKCDPQHNVDVAFTRSLAGPTDYHLGGFRSLSKSDFRARVIYPYVLGTRCHHLALYVVYDNPMPQACDTPSAYEGQPGFEFIETVPTTWDETRFLAGQPGEFIVVARRHGSDWYLGGITNDVPRRLSLPLRFLGPGEHGVTLFCDGSMDPERPNEIALEQRTVSPDDSLEVGLAAGGGFTAIIREKQTGPQPSRGAHKKW
jgi:alpha-glucosidase